MGRNEVLRNYHNFDIFKIAIFMNSTLFCKRCRKHLPESRFNPDFLKKFKKQPEHLRRKKHVACSRCYNGFAKKFNSLGYEVMDMQDQIEEMKLRLSEKEKENETLRRETEEKDEEIKALSDVLALWKSKYAN